MSNPFDQFDSSAGSTNSGSSRPANPFDAFDAGSQGSDLLNQLNASAAAAQASAPPPLPAHLQGAQRRPDGLIENLQAGGNQTIDRASHVQSSTPWLDALRNVGSDVASLALGVPSMAGALAGAYGNAMDRIGGNAGAGPGGGFTLSGPANSQILAAQQGNMMNQPWQQNLADMATGAVQAQNAVMAPAAALASPYEQPLVGAAFGAVQAPIADRLQAAGLTPDEANLASQGVMAALGGVGHQGVGMMRRGLSELRAGAPGAPAAPPPIPQGATSAGNPAPEAGPQSMGAAQTAQDNLLHPEVRQEVQQRRAQGAPVNDEAAKAYSDAAELGVQLSPGEATQDLGTLKREYEDVNGTQAGAQRIRNNADILGQHLENMQADVAPDTVGATNQNLAQDLVQHYTDLEQQRNGVIDPTTGQRTQDGAIQAAYQNLQDVSGGQALPLDLHAVVKNAEANLGGTMADPALQQLRQAGQPTGRAQPQLEIIRQMADNNQPITAPQFTALMRGLADDARNGPDPTSANIVRDALQAMPLKEGADGTVAAAVGQARDAAAGLARQRFQDLERDPAYRQVAESLQSGTPIDTDRFMAHFDAEPGIDNAERTLAGNDAAAQSIAAYHINKLRAQARLDSDNAGTGRLATASLGNYVRRNSGAITRALGPRAADQTNLILRVAKRLSPDYGKAGANLTRSGVEAANRLLARHDEKHGGGMLAGALGLAHAHPGAAIGLGVFKQMQDFMGARRERRALQARTAEAQAFQDRTLRGRAGLDMPVTDRSGQAAAPRVQLNPRTSAYQPRTPGAPPPIPVAGLQRAAPRPSAARGEAGPLEAPRAPDPNDAGVQALLQRHGQVDTTAALTQLYQTPRGTPERYNAVRKLANTLSSRQDNDPYETHVLPHDVQNGARYDEARNRVELGQNATQQDAIRAHVSASVDRYLSANPNSDVSQSLNRLFERAKSAIPDIARQGIDTPRRFLAEALSNPTLQRALGAIKDRGAPGKLWNSLVDAVHKMVGLRPSGSSMLSTALKLHDVISDAPQRELPRFPTEQSQAHIPLTRVSSVSPYNQLADEAAENLHRGNYTRITLRDGSTARMVHVGTANRGRGQGHDFNRLIAIYPDREPTLGVPELSRATNAFGNFDPRRVDDNLGRLYYSTQDHRNVEGGPGLRLNPNVTVRSEGRGIAQRMYGEAEANGGLIPFNSEPFQSGSRTDGPQGGKAFRGSASGRSIGHGGGRGGTVLPTREGAEAALRDPNRDHVMYNAVLRNRHMDPTQYVSVMRNSGLSPQDVSRLVMQHGDPDTAVRWARPDGTLGPTGGPDPGAPPPPARGLNWRDRGTPTGTVQPAMTADANSEYRRANARYVSQVRNAVGTHKVGDVLGHIAGAVDPNSGLGEVVSRLRTGPLGKFLNQISFHVRPDHTVDSTTFGAQAGTAGDSAGLYWPGEHAIEVGQGADVQTALHEIIHAATNRWLHNNENHPVARELESLRAKVQAHIDSELAKAQKLEDLGMRTGNQKALDDATARKNELQQHYGMTDSHEFLSEALTRPSFQKLLQGIKVGPISAWDHVKGAVAKMAGLVKAGLQGQRLLPENVDSALDHALRAFHYISDDTATQPRRYGSRRWQP